MKIFLDTVSLTTIQQWVTTGLIDGVTTNPTLLSKQKSDPRILIEQLCALLPQGHISVEVTQRNADDVYTQACQLASLSSAIVVKIPCHVAYYGIIKRLVSEGILINITLLFTLPQALFMSKLGVAYISPFVGRLDDYDSDGIELLANIRYMLDHYKYSTQLLAASIRHVRHLHDALALGVDAVTLPAAVLEKATKHILTDTGIEQFQADWNLLEIKQFP